MSVEVFNRFDSSQIILLRNSFHHLRSREILKTCAITIVLDIKLALKPKEAPFRVVVR